MPLSNHKIQTQGGNSSQSRIKRKQSNVCLFFKQVIKQSFKAICNQFDFLKTINFQISEVNSYSI